MTTPTSTASQTGDAESGYLSHRQILVVLGGLMAGMFLAALDQSIVGTALPRITSELGGLDKLSWVVTAYLLTSTASTPLWGKISDLYGRRLIFQASIVTFLAGSLLSGLAQDMTQLIGFRAVQGLGGGGLFALALATIGDVIPPRERGRYQGYFGAVFGTSSVLGPVLGGWLAEGPGWRWIFYVNIPIGLVALVVTSVALKMPVVRRDHKIDYLGAATIVAAVTCLLLFTAWSGPDLGWWSSTSVLLLVGGFALAVAFVFVELRAIEPILPMELFRQRVFATSNIFGFIIGLAMFGALIFIPLHLQVVDGMGPTKSGLAMLPLVVGIFSTSIAAGQIMSRTGRYKAFPILGAGTVSVALVLLSRLEPGTPYWQAGLAMWVLGAGLGFTMQVIVTVVQNSVDRRHMGTATSAVTFFRMMGGAFGTALFGAVLSSQLATYLASTLPPGSAPPAGFDGFANNVQKIPLLPEPIRVKVIEAFNGALSDVFLSAVPLVLLAFVVAFFITEVPLKSRESEAADAERDTDLATDLEASAIARG
jgi:EmrB/QacA subfamily drug resistance transporter